MRTRPLLIAVVAIPVIALVALTLRNHDRPAGPTATPAPAARQVSQTRTPRAPDRAAIRSAVKELAGPTREQQLSHFATLETRFRADPVDGAWAGPSEQVMRSASREPALQQYGKPSSMEVHCMGHMCKALLHFDAMAPATDWAELYPVGLGDALTAVRTMVQPRDGGGADLVVFGARAGSERMLDPPPQSSR